MEKVSACVTDIDSSIIVVKNCLFNSQFEFDCDSGNLHRGDRIDQQSS